MTKPSSNYKWQVLAIVMVGTLMSALDASIVNVSIPSMMADFGVGVDDIEWVVTGYMLAFATLMPLTAWLRDRVGHRFLYCTSLVVFTTGSLLCGLAWNLPTLVFARVIQAMGGGALTPTGMAMLSETFPPSERGRALGFWGMGAVMGPAFGPTLGGYLTMYFGWPSIFLINLPIGAIGIYFALKILHKDKPAKESHKPFDLWGFLALTLFLVSFLLGVSKGESEGWTSHYVVTCGILAIIGFSLFLLVESLVPYRIINLSLFKSPLFTVCMILTALRSIANYGGTFLLPLFMQRVRGFDEVESGLLLLPGSFLMALLMPVGGRLADKVGPRWLAIGSFTLLTAYMLCYYNISFETSEFGIIYPLMIRGVGISFIVAPIAAAALNAVATRQAGMASSMMNIIQQVSGSIGIAILSMVLDHRRSYHMNIIGTSLSKSSPAYQETLRGLVTHAHSLGLTMSESVRAGSLLIGRHAATLATVRSFQDAFIVGGLMIALGLIAAFFLPAKPVAGAGHTEPAEL